MESSNPTLCPLKDTGTVTGLWNYITFFPGHCCLAHLQGYGFHGAAITKGHELGWGEGGLTAMEMHSLPVLEGEV